MSQKLNKLLLHKWAYPTLDSVAGERKPGLPKDDNLPESSIGNSAKAVIQNLPPQVIVKWEKEEMRLVVLSGEPEKVDGGIVPWLESKYQKRVALCKGGNQWVKLGSPMRRVNRLKDEVITRLQAEQWLNLPYRYLESVEGCYRAFLREFFDMKDWLKTSERIKRGDFRITGIPTSSEDKPDGDTESAEGVDDDMSAPVNFPKRRIPEALKVIPGIKRAKFGQGGRVYFLVKNGRVVYVGKTNSLWPRRIFLHMDEKEKKFDSVYFVKCSFSGLKETEKAFIDKFKPLYNIQGV